MSIEEYCENLMKKIIASIEKYNGSQYLSSIVLTGSMGRNEPTYSIIDERIFLKSDVEIGLIVKRSSYKVKKLIKYVSSEFEEELNLMIIGEKRIKKGHNYNYSITTPKYKTVFTYDFYNGSKTIWGKEFLKSRKNLVANIDLYEAKRLVGNRIGELIYRTEYLTCKSEDVREQWKGKLLLAIGSAWLIENNLYVSSYREQKKIIKENKVTIENSVGNKFVEEYEKAFSFLRENGKITNIDDILIKKFVSGINVCFQKMGLTVSKTNCFSRYIKYIIRFLKHRCKYNLLSIEDDILQELIDAYAMDSKKVKIAAKAWHDILY